MTYTINELNALMRSARNSVKYDTIDAAYDELIDAFIKTNLTLLGKEVGEEIEGFKNLTTEVVHPDEIVMGTSTVVLRGENSIPGIMVNTNVGVNAPTWTYALEYHEINGCDPEFEVTEGTQTITTMSQTNSQLSPVQHNPNRYVTSGGPNGIIASLEDLNGRVGPWDTITDFTSKVSGSNNLGSMIPKVEATEENIQIVVDAISPVVE